MASVVMASIAMHKSRREHHSRERGRGWPVHPGVQQAALAGPELAGSGVYYSEGLAQGRCEMQGGGRTYEMPVRGHGGFS